HVLVEVAGAQVERAVVPLPARLVLRVLARWPEAELGAHVRGGEAVAGDPSALGDAAVHVAGGGAGGDRQPGRGLHGAVVGLDGDRRRLVLHQAAAGVWRRARVVRRWGRRREVGIVLVGVGAAHPHSRGGEAAGDRRGGARPLDAVGGAVADEVDDGL